MSEKKENTDICTANTMRKRAGESQVKNWVLLGGNRLQVTAVLAVAVFAVFVTGVTVLPKPVLPQLQSGDTIETMFSTMIGAIITGTTLVITIGQLVIAQENGPLDEQRDRMENTMDVRDSVEELTGTHSPADPSTFLGELIGVAEQRAKALRDGISDNENDQLREEVDKFTENLIGNAEVVRDQLDGAQFGTYEVLYAALNFDYARNIFQVERLADEYDDSLSDGEIDLLDDLKISLSLLGPVREYLKTLYFEWVLVSVSQLILYAAIPALIISGIMLMVGDAGMFPGRLLGIPNITWVVGGAFTVTLLPFLLFMAYILRVLTIAKRTLTIEPLILREY